jgi:hypothetical protein
MSKTSELFLVLKRSPPPISHAGRCAVLAAALIQIRRKVTYERQRAVDPPRGRRFDRLRTHTWRREAAQQKRRHRATANSPQHRVPRLSS